MLVDIYLCGWYRLYEGIAAYRTAAQPCVVAVNVSWRLFFMINPLQDQSHNPNDHQQ